MRYIFVLFCNLFFLLKRKRHHKDTENDGDNFILPSERGGTGITDQPPSKKAKSVPTSSIVVQSTVSLFLLSDCVICILVPIPT